jgi:signal transduction histidine kinase
VWVSGHLWQGGDPTDATIVRVARVGGPATLALLLVPAAAALLAGHSNRSERRWCVWIVGSCVGTLVAAGLAWQLGSAALYGAVAALGIGLVALTVGLSSVVAQPRPIVEPLVDAGLVIAGLAVSVGTGWVVLNVARHEQIFGATALSAFAMAVTAVFVVPTIWWLRREFLVHRYGRGSLTAEEISSLTSDLRTAHDPRQILAKAAEMVRATSGLADARIVLDDVATPQGWDGRRLLVGDELVGTMLLRPSHPGGLEARQQRSSQQMLPTIALVARAVALAVEASHARDDVTRERELERARMLSDLHDDLGPVLAGMSMRVAALRATHGLAGLDELSDDLASCRVELRRIVSGLTPPELEDGDAAAAIERLVASFGTGDGTGVRVVLVSAVPDRIAARTSVVAYRAIAEGITNALKHAAPTEVRVEVSRADGELLVEVCDDGAGGALVPGVGLQSLRDRAEEVGGRLMVGPNEGGGTRLALVLPEAAG